MRRFGVATIFGVVFVFVAEALNRLHIGTRETFELLLPGVIAGCMSPDAACSSEGDLHPPGIFALVVQLAVNIGFYGGALYVLLGACAGLMKLLRFDK